MLDVFNLSCFPPGPWSLVCSQWSAFRFLIHHSTFCIPWLRVAVTRVRPFKIRCWLLDVGCWLLDVRVPFEVQGSMLGSRAEPRLCPRTLDFGLQASLAANPAVASPDTRRSTSDRRSEVLRGVSGECPARLARVPGAVSQCIAGDLTTVIWHPDH